ncbi:hypothetical protein F0562_032099 [Nyssa sinensis]|uniref:Uncharacterized protein n=1 Tax=Nyssa sinensis TaxID=561372 RepID=A0A5J5AXZ0_9ASTE|nr:hypothetical protein F0562_032099 [Nyssa sinensis]
MIGSLLNLTSNRSNITFNVGVCAQFQFKPKESYFIALKRVVRYVNATLEYGICPIDKPLVHEFHANLEIVCDQVTAKAFVHGISFDLTHAHIVETLGITREDWPGFLYALTTAPKEEVLARALRYDKSEVFQVIAIDSVASSRHTVVLPFGSVITMICVGQDVPIYTSDMVRELSGPFTRRTLTQSHRHVGPVDVDPVEDRRQI